MSRYIIVFGIGLFITVLIFFLSQKREVEKVERSRGDEGAGYSDAIVSGSDLIGKVIDLFGDDKEEEDNDESNGNGDDEDDITDDL